MCFFESLKTSFIVPTAREITISQLRGSKSSALAYEIFKFSISSLSFASIIKFIFFIRESFATISKFGKKSARITEGKPPPVPTSKIFCFFVGSNSSHFKIASESKICFSKSNLVSFLLIRLV